MYISEFDYNLPKNLIAQFPAEKRDQSNLMVLDRKTQKVQHKKFYNIVDLLNENDVLVMNNTKVIPARLLGKKLTGALIEIFLLEKKQDKIWEVLVKPSKRVKPGTEIIISDELQCRLLNKSSNDKWLVELIYQRNFEEIISNVGIIPLPPYIERDLANQDIKTLDHERYQTVYAKNSGSVAAPTAGLHFTNDLLEKIQNKGIQVCFVTLNVGLGTFKPVRAEKISDHKMDSEQYSIPEKTAEIINNAKDAGKNIVAVGTTTVRTLETAFAQNGVICPTSGKSELFIYPGYEFKVIDKLITNFHLPKSTLLMLVSAFAGKEFVFKAYNEAILNNYRFFSYGDCMLII